MKKVRASGETTRYVDRVIQILFNKGEVSIEDLGLSLTEREEIIGRTVRRLDIEHELLTSMYEINDYKIKLTEEYYKNRRHNESY